MARHPHGQVFARLTRTDDKAFCSQLIPRHSRLRCRRMVCRQCDVDRFARQYETVVASSLLWLSKDRSPPRCASTTDRSTLGWQATKSTASSRITSRDRDAISPTFRWPLLAAPASCATPTAWPMLDSWLAFRILPTSVTASMTVKSNISKSRPVLVS